MQQGSLPEYECQEQAMTTELQQSGQPNEHAAKLISLREVFRQRFLEATQEISTAMETDDTGNYERAAAALSRSLAALQRLVHAKLPHVQRRKKKAQASKHPNTCVDNQFRCKHCDRIGCRHERAGMCKKQAFVGGKCLACGKLGEYEPILLPSIKEKKLRYPGPGKGLGLLAKHVPLGRGIVHSGQGQTRKPGSRRSQA